MSEKITQIEELLKKFEQDPDDPTITEVQRKILTQSQSIHNEMAKIHAEIEEADKEIKNTREQANKTISEFQNVIGELFHKSTYLQGQAQGLVDALLALK